MTLSASKVIRAQARKIFAVDEATSRLNVKLPEGYLVANNSFLHRESAKFAKSETYLAVPVEKSGKPRIATPLLLTGITKIADFAFIASTAFAGQVTSLEDGLPHLLRDFGRLAFILLGRIEPGGAFEQPINSKAYTRLVYNPSFDEEFQATGTDIRINKLMDEDYLWRLVQSQGGWEPEKNFAGQLASALSRLRLEAHDSLRVPRSTGEVTDDGLLDRMTGAFRHGAADYGKALETWKETKSQAALNEVMRIAYNFSSDAMQLAEFVMALSDLKPLILLLTIAEQFQFATAVRGILRRQAVQKPSLRSYSELISDARSAAFHRLVPFSAAIEVDDIELSGVRVRLFPEFQERRSNVLDYEDRPLLELLTQMARPTIREVELSFWEENNGVMRATLDLLGALRAALMTILTDRATSK